MIVYFTEEDLVSFGYYLLSDIRKEYVNSTSDDLSDEIIQDRLKNVSDADLSNWAYLISQTNTKVENKQN